MWRNTLCMKHRLDPTYTTPVHRLLAYPVHITLNTAPGSYAPEKTTKWIRQTFAMGGGGLMGSGQAERITSPTERAPPPGSYYK